MFDHLVLLEAELLTGAFKVNFQEVHHLSANMATFCEICCFTQVPEVFVDSHEPPGYSPRTPRLLPGYSRVVRRLSPWGTRKPLKTSVFTAF